MVQEGVNMCLDGLDQMKYLSKTSHNSNVLITKYQVAMIVHGKQLMEHGMEKIKQFNVISYASWNSVLVNNLRSNPTSTSNAPDSQIYPCVCITTETILRNMCRSWCKLHLPSEKEESWVRLLIDSQTVENLQTAVRTCLQYSRIRHEIPDLAYDCERALLKDAERSSFRPPQVAQQRSRTEHIQMLIRVLRVYSMVDPEVGYAQGMSAFASTIVCYAKSECGAFLVFYLLMNTSSSMG